VSGQLQSVKQSLPQGKFSDAQIRFLQLTQTPSLAPHFGPPLMPPLWQGAAPAAVLRPRGLLPRAGFVGQ
jgi:hypothetical protein